MGEALENVTLTSPLDKYRFQILDSGVLALINTENKHTTFISDTNSYWPSHPSPSRQGTAWTSNFLPNCKGLELTIAKSSSPFLELFDSGLLQIRSDQRILYVLHSATEDKGRLAVLISGFLRTYLQTCTSHVQKILSQWSGSQGVDVHIVTYLEEVFQSEPATNKSIEENLRKCYGTYLKSVSIVSVHSVEDTWTDAAIYVKRVCGDARLNCVISQIKSVYMVGQQATAYMIQHGIQYDYILRMRPDHMLWGTIPPLYEVSHGKVIIPNPAKEWFYYCVTHHGLQRMGTTDQIAYGRASAMWIYMNMYTGIRSMLTMAKDPAVMPQGFATHQHNKWQASDKEICAVECLVAHWMYLNGISMEVDWRWQQNLIRQDGRMEYYCPDKNRTWNCPGSIPN
ncbi:unnamed protein product [Adineta ricciae]|uniref:Uncharacterized protein n=1 Tax=Adineta ricciae TaxID=249248 RepID=A0A813R5S9_ADIRI|nr:unnamed protein product [Adineta ricciae]CAF1399887.1 unnamed protein product [Adineta ricciae]